MGTALGRSHCCFPSLPLLVKASGRPPFHRGTSNHFNSTSRANTNVTIVITNRPQFAQKRCTSPELLMSSLLLTRYLPPATGNSRISWLPAPLLEGLARIPAGRLL